MLPRRTRRSTSRTAKNPANSLVNPWVSRMNSSANQISPISHRREALSRLAEFLPTRQVFPDTSGSPVPGRPPPAGNMPSTAWVTQGGMLGIGQSDRDADSPIVEWHRPPMNRFAGGGRWSRRAARKAAINGVSTQSGIFTKNLRLRPMLGRFASGSDRSLSARSLLDQSLFGSQSFGSQPFG
jgi:hypothetical protein